MSDVFAFIAVDPSEYGEIIWTTKEGYKTALKHMSDQHLYNAANLLRNKSMRFLDLSDKAYGYAATAPDAAALAVENEAWELSQRASKYHLLAEIMDEVKKSIP